MMKVLYISYDGMTDPLGQSQVLPYLVELSKDNIQFHLISFEKHDKFVRHKKHIQQICDDAGILWHPQDYHVEGGISKTMRQVRRMRKVSKYLHIRHNFQIVHCRSYIAALVGLKLKRKFGVKFLFDMRGFWADERVDGKLWDLKNPLYNIIYKYFKRKEVRYLKEADCSVVLTENGKNEILSWPTISISPTNLVVIPCCVNLQLFDPLKITKEQKQHLRDEFKIQENEFLLGYIGSIGTWYMLDEMLDFYIVMKQQKDEAKLLFVTGDDENFIRQKANDKGIATNDIIVTSCLHDEMPLHIAILDHSIFFIRPTYSKKASSPTKQGEIMAMGISLTCNAGVGDTDLVVNKYHAGNVVTGFSQEHYAHALSQNSFDRETTIQGAKEFFSLEMGVKKYKAIYQEING